MLVSEILNIKGKVLYTVAPHQTLQDAIDTMVEQDIGSLVVFEGGVMVGMLTFREMLAAVHKAGKGWREAKVADAMIGKPCVATLDMDVNRLQRMMVDHHQRYLPVIEGTTLLGVVSFHDVAKAMLEEQGFENKMLKSYIRNWPEESNEGK
ncbi:MAG TPA: CBS domain-containing protein [Rhodocyclaceae bacterium]|nr:CBS domain-containing protein [Rhodocyclaceae bacterium]